MKLKGMNKWLEHMLMEARHTYEDTCPFCDAMYDERAHRRKHDDFVKHEEIAVTASCDMCPMGIKHNGHNLACDIYGRRLLAAWEDFFVESAWAFHFYPCKCGECLKCKGELP